MRSRTSQQGLRRGRAASDQEKYPLPFTTDRFIRETKRLARHTFAIRWFGSASSVKNAGGINSSGMARFTVEGAAACATQRGPSQKTLGISAAGSHSPLSRLMTPAERLNFVSFALRSAGD